VDWVVEASVSEKRSVSIFRAEVRDMIIILEVASVESAVFKVGIWSSHPY
jgi:hypothetical protein